MRLYAHGWTSGIVGLNGLVLVASSGRDIILSGCFLRLSVGVNWFIPVEYHPFHILLNVIFEKFVGPLPLAFSTMESTGLK